MKKLLCFALTALLALSAVMTAVFAATPGAKVLVLGDSVSTGYGIDDLTQSYAGLLKGNLQIKDADFTNAAVDGADSGDLIALLPSLESKIEEADIITMTIGGNDLLNLVWDIASQSTGMQVTGPAQIVEIKQDAAAFAKLKTDLMGNFGNFLNACNTFNANIATITASLRQTNPTAQILVINQYNPFSGVEDYADLDQTCGSIFNMLNGYMQTACATNGCTYIDAAADFVGQASTFTNIDNLDIHPNKAGHKVIFTKVKEALLSFENAWTTTAAPTDPPVTPAPETDPPATEPPATEPPATEPPATEPPATEPPATEPPATEPPATEPPATEPPTNTDTQAPDGGDVTTDGATAAPTDGTTAKPDAATTKEPADTDKPAEKGCGGLIASAFIPVALVALAFVTKKKS